MSKQALSENGLGNVQFYERQNRFKNWRAFIDNDGRSAHPSTENTTKRGKGA